MFRVKKRKCRCSCGCNQNRPVSEKNKTEALSVYSVPAQPGMDGQMIVFDKNAFIYGDAISHREGSPEVMIMKPGLYEVFFHGTLAPGVGAELPEQILLYFRLQGTEIAAAEARQTLREIGDLENVSFSQIVKVDSAPKTLNVVASGGNFFYSDVILIVRKLPDPA